MKLTKIHRVLEFDQSPWMARYVEFNTARRQDAKSDFEKDFYKLMVNAVFGKTMENLRNRVNVKLVTDDKQAKKLIAKPSCQMFKAINEDLTLVKLMKPNLLQNKPIFVGFSILELSKVHMYNFHYQEMLAKFNGKARLLFTDTDSLCYLCEGENVYSFMGRNIHLFDTSNYSADHPLYSRQNEKVVGKFKDECGGVAPLQFVGLRPKMYSLLLSNCKEKPKDKRRQNKITCKGVKTGYVNKHVHHHWFLQTLRGERVKPAQFQQFKS